MKYTWIIATLFLMGCKSTPTFCEINSDSKLCDSSDYSANTKEGLDKFEHYKNQKNSFKELMRITNSRRKLSSFFKFPKSESGVLALLLLSYKAG